MLEEHPQFFGPEMLGKLSSLSPAPGNQRQAGEGGSAQSWVPNPSVCSPSQRGPGRTATCLHPQPHKGHSAGDLLQGKERGLPKTFHHPVREQENTCRG